LEENYLGRGKGPVGRGTGEEVIIEGNGGDEYGQSTL
jgi:hypothetical protein